MDRQTHDDPFVAQQLDALMPAWTPDAARARTRLDQAIETPRTSRVFVAAGVMAMLLVAVALTPQARTYAQDVWARWTMTRVDVVATSLPEPFATRGSVNGGGTYSSRADAERAAGFTLHLPDVAVAGEADGFLIFDSVVVEQVIDVTALEAALLEVGAADVRIPKDWDGAIVRAHVRSVVAARYADELTVTQSALPSLDVPVGIPLNDLATALFRAVGMTAEAARSAGLAYAIRPAWLLRVPADGPEHVEPLSLRNGEAWLVAESVSDGGVGEVMVLRSSDSRMYVITSQSRGQAIAVAESLP